MEGIRSFNGAALRQARIDRGLSHDALGRLTGQARPNLIAWEQGRHRPTPGLLVTLADALDIDPLELLDVTEDTATLPDLRGRAGLATATSPNASASTPPPPPPRAGTSPPHRGQRRHPRQAVQHHHRADRCRLRPRPRRPMTPQPTLTEIRHSGLRHHLSDSDALRSATDPWVAARIHHYAHLAGVAPVEAFTDPDAYAAATGRRISPDCWGQADWATSRRLVYVDPARCRTRGAAELVAAHEVGHLRWPQARHSCQFFRSVQTLLATAAAPDTCGRTEQAKSNLT